MGYTRPVASADDAPYNRASLTGAFVLPLLNACRCGRPGRLLARLLLGVFLCLVTPSAGVHAHAYLERADPEPGSTLAQVPQQLRLVFGEPMDPSFSRVQVLDGRGQQVDRGDSRVAPDNPNAMTVSLREGLPDGLYTVGWRTLSTVDGHDANGAYQLVFGTLPEGSLAAQTATAQTATAQTATAQAGFSIPTAVARWWLYVAGGGLFGTLLTWRFVFRRALTGPAQLASGHVAARARILATGFGLALILGVLYGAAAQAATSADVPLWSVFGPPLRDLLSGGRFAAIWWPRFALALVACAVVAWRGVEGTFGDVALAIVPAILLTSSLTSHSAALVSGAYLGIGADWLHFLAVSAWVGGLASLVVLLPAALGDAGRAIDGVRAVAIRRFSLLALTSMAIIVVTGTFQAWLQVGSWEALLPTAYGLSVLAKVLVMLAMVALASFHLTTSHPRLAARLMPTAMLDRMRPFSHTALRVELGLGVLVLVIAAYLTGTPPGREELARKSGETAQAGPVDRRLDAQGVTARIQITPGTVGTNRFSIELPGTDPSTVERAQLTVTYLDQELGSQPLVLQPSAASAGTWELSAPALSQAGSWQAELLVRRTGQDDARSAFRFIVAGPGGANSQASAAVASYPLLPSPMISIAYGLMALGLVVLVAGFRRGGRRMRQAQASLIGAGFVVILAGGYVYAQEQRNGVPLDVVNVRSPVPADAASLARGEQIYQQAGCVSCHGDTGRGDGPAGLRLVPRPADFRVHMAAGHTDGQLFFWVTAGVQNTAMPAFDDRLSVEERWDVINYIRTFANSNVR